jgi:hypothetical protein
MWSLWNSRNDRKHGKSPIPVKLAIEWALDVCFHLILDTIRSIRSQASRTVVQWQKPEAGTVKINTDGSFQVESLVGATGAVIRDDNGAFLKAMVRQIPADGSLLMTEPQWKVILETDSLELVNLWHSHEKH